MNGYKKIADYGVFFSMSPFLKTVFRLDANDDVAGFLDFVQTTHHDPNELYAALYQLLTRSRLRSAFILAMVLANGGFREPIIAIALSAGGIVFHNPTEQARGWELLSVQAETWDEKQQTELYDTILAPLLAQLLDDAHKMGDSEQISQLLKLLKIAVPPFRTSFDEQAKGDALLSEQLKPSIQTERAIINFTAPPPDKPRQIRRVVVAVRSFIYSNQAWPVLYPWPRPLAIEERISTAMNRYGWQAELCLLPCTTLADNFVHIIAACQRHNADLLVLDEDLIPQKKRADSVFHHSYSEQIALLRHTLPSLTIVATLFNAASVDPAALLQTAELLDVVWGTTSPSLPVWNDPAFAHKTLFTPLPHGDLPTAADQPLSSALVFAEPMTAYRSFWLSAAKQRGLSIPTAETSSALAAANGYLLLASHPYQKFTLTNRSFEKMLSGALLVQEKSEDMHGYFIPGEHYLEFSTLDELSAIVQFIADKPQEAEKIRCAGHAFALERYNDTQLIGYLDFFIYFQAQRGLPTPPKVAIVPHVGVSIHRWCQPLAPAELLSTTGNKIAYFPDRNPPQPPISLPGLRAKGAGYEDLLPCDESHVGSTVMRFDFKTRCIIPLTPYIARLDNVRLEFPGFGVFLDRQLLMEESHIDKWSTGSVIGWYGNHSMRRVGQCTLQVDRAEGLFSMPLDIDYHIDRGIDQYDAGPSILISGPSYANWHHWFMEMLPRLWCLTAIPELQTLPLIFRAPLLPYQWETLTALGITAERIRLFTGHLLYLKTLIFPSHIVPGNFSVQNVDWLRSALLPAFGIDTTIPTVEYLYLSRSQIADRSRVLNEERVVAALQSRGFRVVYLEQMSVKEQLQTLNKAKVMVAPFGSGGTNIVFAQPGTTLIELSPPAFNLALHTVYASLNNCHYGCLVCKDGNPSDLEIMVDVDALLRVVDAVLAG